MKKNIKMLVMGLFACSAFTFSAVSCMQYFIKKGQSYEFIDVDTLVLEQKNPPEKGDMTAKIKTSMGDIDVVLYPEYAPVAVENFTKLAESGYYDNTYVYELEPGVCLKAGTPLKNGHLDDNKPEGNEEWEQETHQNLWSFRGALCSLSTSVKGGFWDRLNGNTTTYNGSRFAILNSVEFTEEFKAELYASNEDTTIADAYVELGGVPALAQKITVFGQTYDGFDVIDKITSAATITDGDDSHIPVEDIMIETIEIGTYDGEETSE